MGGWQVRFIVHLSLARVVVNSCWLPGKDEEVEARHNPFILTVALHRTAETH